MGTVPNRPEQVATARADQALAGALEVAAGRFIDQAGVPLTMATTDNVAWLSMAEDAFWREAARRGLVPQKQ